MEIMICYFCLHYLEQLFFLFSLNLEVKSEAKSSLLNQSGIHVLKLIAQFITSSVIQTGHIYQLCMYLYIFVLLLCVSSGSKSDMSRLRLAAGGAIMKLAQEPCYHDIITPEQFQLCGLVINVSVIT